MPPSPHRGATQWLRLVGLPWQYRAVYVVGTAFVVAPLTSGGASLAVTVVLCISWCAYIALMEFRFARQGIAINDSGVRLRYWNRTTELGWDDIFAVEEREHLSKRCVFLTVDSSTRLRVPGVLQGRSVSVPPDGATKDVVGYLVECRRRKTAKLDLTGGRARVPGN